MNQRIRRSFTKEFKHEAASLVVDQGYSMAEASRAYGRWENTGDNSRALEFYRKCLEPMEELVSREQEHSDLKVYLAISCWDFFSTT